ncbi:hypothetical protein VPH234P9_0060, partial [Vibrio phage 234P9]
MTKGDTKFGKDSQPVKRRGKSQKTIILDAIRENAMLDVAADATNEDVERAFIAHTAERAFNPKDKASSMLLGILWNKGWKSIKPTSECVQFEFDEGATPTQQAAQILKAASEGVIPPDIAKIFIEAISTTLRIKEVTELEARLAALEEAN